MNKVMDMIVKDIIDLKLEADNVQKDATIKNMHEWYTWAIGNGQIELAYKYGELQGFLEWTRLHEIPESLT